jgi:hypothetical protein
MGNIGATADFRLAACAKSLTEAIVAYTDNTDIYTSKLSGGAWGGFTKWTKTLNSINGISCHYDGDWDFIITGEEATTTNPGVWTCLLGDGYSAAVGTWTSLKEHAIVAAGEDIHFEAPFLDKPDVFRAFYVEHLAAPAVEVYFRPVYTHSTSTADWIDNSLREPVPFNLANHVGLALCHGNNVAWLTKPNGVWSATYAAAAVDLTADVLQVKADASPERGGVDVVFRNDDGRYNTLGSGTYAAIKLASEVQFSPGYVDAGGTVRVSDGPKYWITGWEYLTMRGRSHFVLHATDGWGLLDRWKARRQFSWAEAELNIFNLLKFVHARAGVDFSSWGTLSDEMTTHKPAFTISPGESGRTVALRLLRKTREVLLFRGFTDYATQPQADDSSDYTYGTDHAILEGRYGQQIMPINRAQVTGDDGAIFTEDFDWDEVALVGDIIAQADDTYLNSAAKAHRQGAAMIRGAVMQGLTGQIVVPLNAGQEIYDVVTLTDALAGLSGAKRRVLGLVHTFNAARGEYTMRIDLGDV